MIVIAIQLSHFNKCKMVSSEQLKPAVKKKKLYKVKCSKDWVKSFAIVEVNESPHAFYCMACKKSVFCYCII